MKLINYNDLTVGMRVQDREGNIGTVKECTDIHNILVEYRKNGSGLYCLVEDCKENMNIDGVLIQISQYDPLYYV